MKHVIVCREYPPARLPPGGIGTYVMHVSELLAQAGETIHVVTERWDGAPHEREERLGGRLVIHRVSGEGPALARRETTEQSIADWELWAMRTSAFPAQAFGWQASLLVERLVEEEGVDVIEAQEWEAPLYYFQLRRALGLGPTRRPPCVVHLHSPTELIFRANGWDIGRPDYPPMKRMEDYSIRAADGWLCPSQYLAHDAERHYGLGPSTVTVIPLPIGKSRVLARRDETWKRGSVCYVGRLEPRKGVLEWVEAAVGVAQDLPELHFELIGADLPHVEGSTVRQAAERMIPERLLRQFHFRGSQPRDRLAALRAEARIAVVPSRWENFPNTCVEAMASGLPVLATRHGGMAEMIDDGRTGWLTDACSPEALADGLRRALDTPPAALAEMGRAAAQTIHTRCDNGSIVERHVEFRRRLTTGKRLSNAVPAPLGNPPSPRRTRSRGSVAERAGIAIVVDARDDVASLPACLASIADQRRAPASVIVVGDPARGAASRDALELAAARGWTVLALRTASAASARNAGVREVLRRGDAPRGFVCLEPRDRLDPRFVQLVDDVLARCPEVGIVSPWAADGAGALTTPPCPALPYQLIENDVSPVAAVRSEALLEVGLYRRLRRPGYEAWDLANVVIAAGWTAVTLPALLATGTGTRPRGVERELLERVPHALAAGAIELAVLLDQRCREQRAPEPRPTPVTPPPSRLWRVLRAVRHPRRAARAVLWHVETRRRRIVTGARNGR